MWQLLVHRDHWQGEFCVALFGAVGWAILSSLFPAALERTTYDVMTEIMPQWCWNVWFAFFGIMQIVGLMLARHWHLRLAGAIGVFIAFNVAVYGIVSSRPIPLGLSVYFACAAIEGFAVIHQTAQMVRLNRGLARWIIKRR